jgi:hypothetical protein
MAGNIRKPESVIRRVTNVAKGGSFAADLSKTFEDIVATEADQKRKMSLGIWGMVVEKTPVDTGRARNGWGITQYTPGTYVPPEGKKSYPKPKKPSAVSQKAKVTLQAPLFIFNNVNYIGHLNEGSSKKADPKFVETSILKILSQFK